LILNRLNRFRGTVSSFPFSPASRGNASMGIALYRGEAFVETEFWRVVGFEVFVFGRFKAELLFVRGFDNLFGGRRGKGADCSLPITTKNIQK
jgi:hypothetical protein